MPQENFGRVDQALATPEASIPAELPWTDDSVLEEVRDALAAPIGSAPVVPEQFPVPGAGAPELERRVRTLERVLQALLAQLEKSEPELLDRLKGAFTAASQKVRTVEEEEVDAAAAALIEAARRDAAAEPEAQPEVAGGAPPEAEAPRGDKVREQPASRQPRFRYRKVGGIWRLTMERPPRAPTRSDEDAPAKAKTPSGAVTPAR